MTVPARSRFGEGKALTVASLHIYPIKSLGGFSVEEARTTERGFEHDRRWMLVDENGRFFSQREIATMACLHCSPAQNGFQVTDIRTEEHLELPWALEHGDKVQASVWADPVIAVRAPAKFSEWFSDRLGRSVSLVFMPDGTRRPVDPTYATGITSLSDGFPYLIISQASLDDLNARISSAHPHISPSAHSRIARSADPHIHPSAHPLPMDRFRPNIVVEGGAAFQEDEWRDITIGDVRFSLVKPCARCVIPTTDQRSGERGPEPLRTLAGFRRRVTPEGAVKVEFGMNAMALGGDIVRVGDLVAQ